MVLIGSGRGGVIDGVVFVGAAKDDGTEDLFSIGKFPNSTTAGLGTGTESFFEPIISSAIVGILKFGAFNIGRGTDSVWKITGLIIDEPPFSFAGCGDMEERGVFVDEGCCGVDGAGGTAATGSFAGGGEATEICAFGAGRTSSNILGIMLRGAPVRSKTLSISGRRREKIF
jgi:hypothetical protein